MFPLSPLFAAASATMFTFVCTTLGAALILPGRRTPTNRPVIAQACFGFAAGVMMAASVWSLLIPAMTQAAALRLPVWLTAAIGFMTGGGLLWAVDHWLEVLIEKRRATASAGHVKRTWMLVIAITLHNIPEGMAVGLACALAAQSGDSGALASAAALAIGIGLQNLPEGAAIALPLRSDGVGKARAFACGALSGLVEPVFGLLAVIAAGTLQSLMPWMLSAAAGAMIFVVASELIPAAAGDGKPPLGTIGVMLGFVLMMVLDVALG